jgi:hypothetical protein
VRFGGKEDARKKRKKIDALRFVLYATFASGQSLNLRQFQLPVRANSVLQKK